MAAYIAAKRNIVAHQRTRDVAVLGYDEPNAQELASATRGEVRYFSGRVEIERGAFLRGDTLMLRRPGDTIALCARDDLRVRGAHNVLNTLAAMALADAAGASVDAMRQAIAAFTGVEHRLEDVRRWGGALWVNDSIATAPERVLAALAAFDAPLILLAGGRDKDLPWEAFARRVVTRVRVLITFGEAGPLIRRHVEAVRTSGAGQKGQPWEPVLEEIVAAGTLEQAVAAAAQRVQAGDVVLLSPGGTSFDAYQDFEARGEHFRALVNELKDEGRRMKEEG
jgi:UDP-N-acetylmuramoylalanine--D-glutamate ligase